jgi:radical SAM superfamily enzyme YgiQ (UPF0313 family)
MDPRWPQIERIRELRSRERGRPWPIGQQPVAMVYPATYRVGMASLGFQWIAHQLAEAGLGVERAFLPSDGWGPGDGSVRSMESEVPIGDFPLIAATVAWELELDALVRLLESSGIPALRSERGPEHPAVLLGGPLTFSNPRPMAAIADAILVGEADATAAPAALAFFAGDRGAWLDAVASLPGGWAPERGGPPPEPARAEDNLLPAVGRMWSPDADFADMLLVEAERGCSRRCAFCVMRRDPGPGMRLIEPERILAAIPDEAPRVGLVGAAVSDHPRLLELIEALIAQGKGVGVSSLRADRIARQPRLAELLRLAGYRSLTVAADAPSAALRDAIQKDIRTEHLLACAELAREHGYERVKLYAMIGLPGETDADMAELVALARDMAAIHPLDLAVSPFVPKRRTPLEASPYAGIKVVEKRIALLKKGLRGVAGFRPTSARWAWVESELAAGSEATGVAAVHAVRAGGKLSAWKRSLGGRT